MTHMGIDKAWLLAHGSIYWIDMNDDIEKTVKYGPTCLAFCTSPKDRTMSHKIPQRSMEAVGTEIFTINKEHYLCITANYHSILLVIQQLEGLNKEKLIKHARLWNKWNFSWSNHIARKREVALSRAQTCIFCILGKCLNHLDHLHYMLSPHLNALLRALLSDPGPWHLWMHCYLAMT